MIFDGCLSFNYSVNYKADKFISLNYKALKCRLKTKWRINLRRLNRRLSKKIKRLKTKRDTDFSKIFSEIIGRRMQMPRFRRFWKRTKKSSLLITTIDLDLSVCKPVSSKKQRCTFTKPKTSSRKSISLAMFT
jgi:hypothetical protein